MVKGRRPGSPDTRREILDAARVEFTARGYSQATIRSIAALASVDAALVMHYFESKELLFAASLDLPVSPAVVIRRVFESAQDHVGEVLVRTMLEIWDDDGGKNALIAALRSATGEGPIHDMVREFINATVLNALIDHVAEPDRELRAALIGAQLSGLLVGRYLVELEPLVEASVEELASRVGAVIDVYAHGDTRV